MVSEGEGDRVGDEAAAEPDPSTTDAPPPIIQRGPSVYSVTLPALDYRSLHENRSAEVAMLVRRAPGWFLLHSKRGYPPGVFRVPTGTIEPGETAAQAMERELHEEANLRPSRYRLLFQLEYRTVRARLPVTTTCYLIDAPEGELHPNDPTEAINAWRQAQPSELPQVAHELRRLQQRWRPWGQFRAPVHDLAFGLLETVPMADDSGEA